MIEQHYRKLLERKTELAALLAVLVVLSIGLIQASGVLQAGSSGDLVAEYRFDEGGGDTAYDSAGDNDGNLANDPQWIEDSQRGVVLEFEGGSDYEEYVSLDSDLSFDSGEEWTATAWFNPSDHGDSWHFWFGDRGSVGESLLLRSDETVRIRDADGDYTTFGSAPGLFDGTYKKITWVSYGDGSMAAFHNGELIGEEGGIATGLTFNNIGNAYSSGAHTSYEGSLDNVQLYSRALSEDEIKSLYNEGSVAISGAEEDDSPQPVLDMDFNIIENGEVIDRSGNENHGMPQNGASQETALYCKVERCYSFDGNDDYIDFSATPQPSELAFGGWFKIEEDNSDSWHSVMSSRDSGEGYWIFVNEESGERDISYNIGFEDGSRIHDDLRFNEIEEGEWYHAMMTWDGTTARAYLNGRLIGETDSYAGKSIDHGNSLRIGSDSSSGYYLNGKIDNVRIYDQALSQEEIIREAGLPRGGAVLDMRFNEGGGDIARDLSMYENHGELVNGPEWVETDRGTALEFDGDDARVEVGDIEDGSSLDMGQRFSVSFWSKPFEEGTGLQGVASTGGVTDTWSVRNNDGEMQFRVFGQETFTSSESVDTTEFTHWTFVMVDDTWTWYKNGEEVNSGSNSYDLVYENLYVGRYHGYETFPGILDDIIIYPYSLSENEVKQKYAQGASRFGSDSKPPQRPDDESLVLHQSFDRVELCGRPDTMSCSDTSLVGYWAFEEGSGDTAYDTSLNDYDGTIMNDAQWTDGRLGKALRFDGDDNYIDIGSLDPDTNELTISLWIKASENTLSEEHKSLVTWGTWDEYVTLYLREDEDNHRLRIGDDNHQWPYPHDALEGQWKHISAVIDNGEASIYVDGNEIAYFDDVDTELDLSGDLEFGQYGDVRRFDGKMDEVRIYDRALASAEVQALHRMTGDIAVDESGGENHGELVNGPVEKTGNECVSGRCLEFDGDGSSGGYVEIENDDSINSEMTELSLSFWVKPEFDSDFVAILDATEGTWNDDGYSFYLRPHQSEGEQFSWTVDGSYIRGGTVRVDEWRHVVATLEGGSEMCIHVDGRELGCDSAPSSATTTSDSNWIGRMDGRDWQYPQKIDDFRIHDRSLSEEEIWHLYSQGRDNLGPTEDAGPAGHWRFEPRWNEVFEVGNLEGWEVHNDDFEIRTDRVHAEGYSAGMTETFSEEDDGYGMDDELPEDGTIALASKTPEGFEGGVRPESFEYYWQADSSSRGAGIALYDSYGNEILGLNNDNPQWCVFDDESPETCERLYGGYYDTWTRYYVEFNWEEGTYDYVFETADGDSTHTGTRTLRHDTNIERIRVQNCDAGCSSVGYNDGHVYEWFDSLSFSSPVFDTSGEDNHGTNYDAEFIMDDKRGAALEFDGEGDSVHVAGEQIPDYEFALSTWFYADSDLHPSGWGSIVSSGNTGSENVRMLVDGSSEGRAYVSVDGSQDGETVGWSFDQWHHYVYSFDGTDLTVYLDGEPVVTREDADISSIDFGAGGGPLFGIQDDEGTRPFGGKIDDVRIYPYALSEKQVKQVMNQGGAAVG